MHKLISREGIGAVRYLRSRWSPIGDLSRWANIRSEWVRRLSWDLLNWIFGGAGVDSLQTGGGCVGNSFFELSIYMNGKFCF